MRVWLLVALNVVLVVVAISALRLAAEVADDRLVVGQWEELTDKPWVSAVTGWRGPGQRDLPLVNTALDGGPITLDGRTFEDGLGLYPFAEVVYRLDEGYSLFQATVGVRPREWSGEGGARILVYGDDAPLFDSGPLRVGMPPRDLSISVGGVRELRLVVAALDGETPAYAYLGEPRLLRPLVAGAPASLPGRTAALLALRQQRQRVQRAADLEAVGAERARTVQRWRIPQANPDAVIGGRLPDGTLALAGPELAVVVDAVNGAGGPLAVLDLVHGRLIASGLDPAVVLPAGATYPLSTLAQADPDAYLVVPTEVTGLGRGQVLHVPLVAPDGGLRVTLAVTLFPDRRALLLQIEADQPVERFVLLGGDAAGLVLGDDLHYITDFSRPREARVRDDGLERPELVSIGAPVFLWSEESNLGLVLAALDETAMPPQFAVRREPGDLLARARFETEPLALGGEPTPTRSPRLYLEPTSTADPRVALAPFRTLSETLYPAPPLPAWVRHQWGTWYVYGTHIDEEKVREHLDYIAEYLGDVGPWHLLLDAGWFIAEGREGAELAAVDTEKFPSGIRALVNYAHRRGIRVMLYYSAPYVDTRPVVSEWLALPGFIAKHRDWLLPLGAVADHASYVYDFSNPGLQAYMRDVLRRYFVEWNADGLLIDMLGHTEGAALNFAPPDRFGVVRPALGQTMAIYRFLWRETQRLKPDVFVEGAWDTPLTARPYAHTWRYADDTAAFHAPYPFPGLVEHIDYAVLQHLMLGQRPHMGAVIGRPDARINQWWLGAGLALGTQVVLSLPLTTIPPADLDEYRAYLTQARPFEGTTALGAGFHPDTFATTVDGTTFLGVLNRQRTERAVPVDLEELGLAPDTPYLAYDPETGGAFTVAHGFVATLPGETFRLYVLRKEPGVLWTSSSYQPRPGRGCLRLTLGGPPSVPGYLYAHVPTLRGVSLDGQPLAEGDGPDSYRYDAALGLLSLRYTHAASRDLRVDC